MHLGSQKYIYDTVMIPGFVYSYGFKIYNAIYLEGF